MLRRIFILTLTVAFPAIILAQGFYGRNNWKNRKHEFAIGGGASLLNGDLGGGKGTGGRGSNTSLTPLDFDLNSTKWGVTFEYMQRIGNRASVRTNFVYAKVYGDDNKSAAPVRKVRLGEVNSYIFELSQIYIYHFNREQIGHLYSLRNNSGSKLGIKPFTLGSYIFAGVGVTAFNPKVGELGTGEKLQPLGTGGQHFKGRNPYRLVTASFPLGFGVRHSINPTVGVKLELGYRFTLTDYLDDYGHDKYVYNNINEDPENVEIFRDAALTGTGSTEKADLATYFHNVSGNTPGGYAHANVGGYRGDREKDGYAFLMMTFYFNRDPRHWFNEARRAPIKVRRPRASF